MQALRDLAIKFDINFSHFTEQSHHNKDRVDGEFSRFKDALTLHLTRHNPGAADHIEVTNSESFVKFAEKKLTSPGPKSGITERKFYDLKKSEIDERIADKPSFKTLNGIKSVFQYICKSSGEVLWRKLPCFCELCCEQKWESCPNSEIVGKVKVVVKAGVDF